MLGLAGLTTACGNADVRKPSPKSPLPPVVVSVATVTVAPNVTPRSVDLRINKRCVADPSYQNAYTAWSDPTAIHAPCTDEPVTIFVPLFGPHVAPPSVDLVSRMPLFVPKSRTSM